MEFDNDACLLSFSAFYCYLTKRLIKLNTNLRRFCIEVPEIQLYIKLSAVTLIFDLSRSYFSVMSHFESSTILWFMFVTSRSGSFGAKINGSPATMEWSKYFPLRQLVPETKMWNSQEKNQVDPSNIAVARLPTNKLRNAGKKNITSLAEVLNDLTGHVGPFEWSMNMSCCASLLMKTLIVSVSVGSLQVV